MKLSQVLSQINQVEKSKFINCLDKIRNTVISTDTKLASSLSSMDGQLRSASGGEITTLFNSVTVHFRDYVREQISLGGPQIALLVNILSRDGNGIARPTWIEHLYELEHQRLSKLCSQLENEINAATDDDSYSRARRLGIYKECFKTAYTNDLRLNRESKITDDERMILNTLSAEIGMSNDEAAAIEHMLVPVPSGQVQEALNTLREIGLVFIDKKRNEVLIPDEIVSILHDVHGRELSDKHVLRILRSITDADLSNILRRHDQKARGVSRREKIHFIVKSGMPIRGILSRDMFSTEDSATKRKDRLKILMDDLNIMPSKIGTTLDDRIDVILNSLKSASEEEFNSLSVSGFKELIDSLSQTKPPILDRLRDEFEIENTETLDPDRLRALGISPLDILYVYSNEEIKTIRDSLKLSNRKNPRSAILESYASATDKLIENYGLLATRDLAGLKAAGIEIKESEIGLKFEEITRTLFEDLGLEVDEDLRKEINTAKDKVDIIVSLSDDDVIIGEVKSYKNGDFAKYSTTSRQVKAYVKRCETNGKRVAQVLIIAPAFSKDFIESAEMDADVNISLLEAEGLKSIVLAYKARRNPNFSAKLLTKGGLLKSDLIAKTI